MICECGKLLDENATACPECGRTRSRKRKFPAAILILLLVAVGGCVVFGGIVSAIAVPNFLNAIDRGKQKRTMADMRTVAGAIESYAIDHNHYPLTDSFDELEKLLEPRYERTLPTTDGWQHPFAVQAYGDGYVLGSGGKDGEGPLLIEDGGGATSSFNDAIVFSDGQFIQWPEGTQY